MNVSPLTCDTGQEDLDLGLRTQSYLHSNVSGKYVHNVLTQMSCDFSGRYESCYLE